MADPLIVADPLDSPPITSIEPTQELTGSEIVPCEIDPVLFFHLLTTNTFPQTEHWDNDQDRRSVLFMTESWQVRSCRFESYLAQCYSRYGDALVVRPLTPWLINKLPGGSPIFYHVYCAVNR